MEEDITIDWETFVKSQLHWIRVVYKVKKQICERGIISKYE